MALTNEQLAELGTYISTIAVTSSALNGTGNITAGNITKLNEVLEATLDKAIVIIENSD